MAVEQPHHAPCSSGGGLVVGDHHQGRADVSHERRQQVEHGPPRGGIEVAGGLVGEQQPGTAHQGAGDRRPLHLATGELARQVPGPVGDAHAVEHVGHGGVRRPSPAPVEQQGQLDVLRHAQAGQEVEELEHEADVAPAQAGPLGHAQPGQVAPVDAHGAGVGHVEAARQVQQGRLARPGRPDQGDGLPLDDGEVDTVERDDVLGSAPEVLDDTVQFEQLGHGTPAVPPRARLVPSPHAGTARSARVTGVGRTRKTDPRSRDYVGRP